MGSSDNDNKQEIKNTGVKCVAGVPGQDYVSSGSCNPLAGVTGPASYHFDPRSDRYYDVDNKPDLGECDPASDLDRILKSPTQEELRSIVTIETLSRVNLKSFLIAQDGKFIGIDFVKNNGLARSLNGRLGVVYPLKGGENKSEQLANSYLTIFDVKAGGYRNINLETVSRLRAQHKVYDVLNVDGKTPIIG